MSTVMMSHMIQDFSSCGHLTVVLSGRHEVGGVSHGSTITEADQPSLTNDRPRREVKVLGRTSGDGSPVIPTAAFDDLVWAPHFGDHVVLGITHQHLPETGVDLHNSGLAVSE